MEQFVPERITSTVSFHRLEQRLPETSTVIGCHLSHSYYANFLHLYPKQDADMDVSMVVKKQITVFDTNNW